MSSRKRIFVIDDDEFIRDTLTLWLEKEGFKVTTIRDPRVAKEKIKEGRPDLILMDVMMPGMNGIDLCRWVWEQPEFKNVPVIQMSALGDEATMQDSMEVGSMDYIHKPFECPEVLKKVKAALARIERRTQGDAA